MEMVREMNNLNRTLSNHYKNDYYHTIDELNSFIEEFMELNIKKTPLKPAEAAILMQQLSISYEISKERKLPIETRYYGELLSKLIKNYGH